MFTPCHKDKGKAFSKGHAPQDGDTNARTAARTAKHRKEEQREATTLTHPFARPFTNMIFPLHSRGGMKW